MNKITYYDIKVKTMFNCSHVGYPSLFFTKAIEIKQNSHLLIDFYQIRINNCVIHKFFDISSPYLDVLNRDT